MAVKPLTSVVYDVLSECHCWMICFIVQSFWKKFSILVLFLCCLFHAFCFIFFSSELQLFELVVTYAANTLVTDLQINCMLVEHVMDNEGCLCLVFFMGEGIISYNATTTPAP